jgi:hypothetical protein
MFKSKEIEVLVVQFPITDQSGHIPILGSPVESMGSHAWVIE